jgi:hypothetical protein
VDVFTINAKFDLKFADSINVEIKVMPVQSNEYHMDFKAK